MNPSDDQIRADYDLWHSTVHTPREEESPTDFAWHKSVWNNITNHPGGKVLEIGCGRGGFAIWLMGRSERFKITGLDFSFSAIELARKAAAVSGSAAEFLQGDAESLPFPDSTFDLVISCECIEHVPHPPVMAKEIARVLKSGGRFCLTTENYFNGMLLAWIKCWLTRTPFNSGTGVQPRENFFFYWMIKAYLKKAGLIVTSSESCHYQWLLLPRVDPAKLCTEQFRSNTGRFLAKPFGRHFSFFGVKA
jgi:ubiquinone/menaquinone biosynthesis C-methylase UbiE